MITKNFLFHKGKNSLGKLFPFFKLKLIKFFLKNKKNKFQTKIKLKPKLNTSLQKDNFRHAVLLDFEDFFTDNISVIFAAAKTYS